MNKTIVCVNSVPKTFVRVLFVRVLKEEQIVKFCAFIYMTKYANHLLLATIAMYFLRRVVRHGVDKHLRCKT